MSHASVDLRGERLDLLVEKAVFWPAQRTLVIADLHLGKAMHFRRSGIAAPPALEEENLTRFASLMHRVKPKEVLLLGDLFHSVRNAGWGLFASFRRMHPTALFTLITGNHDILHPDVYAEADIVCRTQRISGPFLFTHHPTPDPEYYNVAGHIHPGVRLIGKGKQAITLPCFLFGPQAAILPAFGAFTGTHVPPLMSGDRVFAITKERVLQCDIPTSGSPVAPMG